MNKNAIFGLIICFLIFASVYELIVIRKQSQALAEAENKQNLLTQEVSDLKRHANTEPGRPVPSFSDAFSERGALESTSANTDVMLAAGSKWSKNNGPHPKNAAEARIINREINGKAIDSMYAEMYRKLGLDAVEQAQFRNLKLDWSEKGQNLFREAAAADKEAHTHMSIQLVHDVVQDQIAAGFQQALRSTFGDAVATEIINFQQLAHIDDVASTIVTSAGFSTDSQSATATNLATEIKAHSKNSIGIIDLTAMDVNSIIKDLQSSNSPQQLSALRASLESEKELAKERVAVLSKTAATLQIDK